MNPKSISLVLVILGLCLCLTAVADDEARLMRENSDWHITTEVYANPPYWLVPTNVPFRLGPLSNGKWAWTTNHATWFGLDEVDVHMDSEREQQIEKEWNIKRKKQWLASLPPGVANVEIYRHYHWDADILKYLWRGAWAEDTNTGWGVLVNFYTNYSGTIYMNTSVGSKVANSGAGFLPSPDHKYARLQLTDSGGKVVPSKKGAALRLYETYPQFSEPLTDAQWNEYCIGSYRPSAWDASVERNYPETLSDLEYPRWRINGYEHEIGDFTHYAGFTSNGPPCEIGYVNFNDIFAIKTEGDYRVTVQPVLFRQHNEGGTFQGYLDRVDLPSVTTKVHLVPNGK